MKKAQNTIEFVIVILFFLIVTVMFMFSYLRIFPTETAKVREQIACSHSETLAIQLLELQGNQINWDSGGGLHELGFATSTGMEIDYDKFETAKTRGYYNITTDANLSIPFKISYTAYAFNYTEEVIPTSTPENYNPRVFIVRSNNNILIYAGSNSTTAELSLTLFFPFTTVTNNSCDSGVLETGDINTTNTKSDGDEIKLAWSVGDSDLDCINLTPVTMPDLIFIRQLSFKNTSTGQDYPIYLWNETILNNEFGSSGDIDHDKSYCEVERFGILIDGAEKVLTKFKILSWR
jgi:hypothetical protein